jgi:hypothetical protein
MTIAARVTIATAAADLRIRSHADAFPAPT